MTLELTPSQIAFEADVIAAETNVLLAVQDTRNSVATVALAHILLKTIETFPKWPDMPETVVVHSLVSEFMAFITEIVTQDDDYQPIATSKVAH